MHEKPTTLHGLLRAAIQTQVELGLDEMIVRKDLIAPPQPAAAPEAPVADERWVEGMESVVRQPETPVATTRANLFGETVMPTPEPEYESLEAHRAAICECENCPLGQSRTNFVYGTGHPNANLMFVGEAPGAEEDRRGEPFVGKAGQLLNKILAAMNLEREQVYIANILKCRPPNNRDPLPEEMETCFPYLKEQIRLIRPKVICALGRIAAQGLLNTKAPLSRIRKRWHEYEGVPMLATYHPAALLRFPDYKRDTWEDMKQIIAKLEELEK